MYPTTFLITLQIPTRPTPQQTCTKSSKIDIIEMFQTSFRFKTLISSSGKKKFWRKVYIWQWDHQRWIICLGGFLKSTPKSMGLFLIGNKIKFCREVNTFQGRVRNICLRGGAIIVKCQGLWRKCEEAEGIAFYGPAHIL